MLLAKVTIKDYFLDVVSADEMPSFKLNPAIYYHCLKRAGVSESDAWLI